MNYVLIHYTIKGEEGTTKTELDEVLDITLVSNDSDLPDWCDPECMDYQHCQHRPVPNKFKEYLSILDWDECDHFEAKDNSWIYIQLVSNIFTQVRSKRIEEIIK